MTAGGTADGRGIGLGRVLAAAVGVLITALATAALHVIVAAVRFHIHFVIFTNCTGEGRGEEWVRRM